MVSFARGWNHLPVLPGSKKALEIPFFETSIVDFPTAFRWSNPWVASCPHFPSHPWAEDLWHVSFRGVAITKWLRPNVVSQLTNYQCQAQIPGHPWASLNRGSSSLGRSLFVSAVGNPCSVWRAGLWDSMEPKVEGDYTRFNERNFFRSWAFQDFVAQNGPKDCHKKGPCHSWRPFAAAAWELVKAELGTVRSPSGPGNLLTEQRGMEPARLRSQRTKTRLDQRKTEYEHTINISKWNWHDKMNKNDNIWTTCGDGSLLAGQGFEPGRHAELGGFNFGQLSILERSYVGLGWFLVHICTCSFIQLELQG